MLKYNFTIFNTKQDDINMISCSEHAIDCLSDRYESVLNPNNKPKDNHRIMLSVEDMKSVFGIFSHSCYQFKSNSRKIDNIESASGIIIDFDKTETIVSFQEKILQLNLNYILYTSKSHRLNGNGDRFHVFFPFKFNRTIENPKEYNYRIKEFINYLRTSLNLDVDFQVSDCARLIYQSQSSLNLNYRFISVFNGVFIDFNDGKYFLPIEQRKSKTAQRNTVKKPVKEIIVRKEKYREKTRQEKKLSLFLNPLLPQMSLNVSRDFFRDNLNSFIIDDRFLRNRDDFGETTDNKYIMTVLKSVLFLLKEHRYITRDCRTVPIRYLRSALSSLSRLDKARLDTMLKNFKMSCFVESHDNHNITIMSNKHFEFTTISDQKVSFTETITTDDINRLFNITDSNDKNPRNRKYKFSISIFVPLLCIIYSSKPTLIYKDSKDNETGYNQQLLIADALGITKQYVSKILSDFDKLYYCLPLRYFNEISDARSYVIEYEKNNDKNIKVIQLEDSTKGKFLAYKTIGSRCILDKAVYRIRNYKVINGKFDGQSTKRYVPGFSKISKQDVVKNLNSYEFYNKGKKVSHYDFKTTGVYTQHGLDMVGIFMYISKKVYKTNNIAYCSLGNVLTFFEEEGDKKPKIKSIMNNDDLQGMLPDRVFYKKKKPEQIIEKKKRTDRFNLDEACAWMDQSIILSNESFGGVSAFLDKQEKRFYEQAEEYYSRFDPKPEKKKTDKEIEAEFFDNVEIAVGAKKKTLPKFERVEDTDEEIEAIWANI